MTDDDVGRFFDTLTKEYSETIVRCFPRYWEMLSTVTGYLPQERSFNSILELGCGTGNLSLMMREAYPDATLRVVDIARESLDVCRARLSQAGSATSERNVSCEQNDFRDLDYDAASFDLVVSSISIHHLESAAKKTLYRSIHEWLTDDGVFCFADQFAGATADLYAQHIENWKKLSFEAGTSTTEWEMWMQHQAEHDHHDTLLEQFQWLQEAGFAVVDCSWRYLLWSVVQARKRSPVAY